MGTTVLKTKQATRGEPARASSIELAIAVIFDRFAHLPKADRADLLDLVKALGKATGPDEQRSIHDAMLEILDQEPSQVRLLDLTDKTPDDGLEKWKQFVGTKVRETRKKRALTQEQLAEKSGLPQSHISRIENGEHSPSHKTVAKLAKALRIPVAQLGPSEAD